MGELEEALQLIESVKQYESQNPTLSNVCQKLVRKVKADVEFLKKRLQKKGENPKQSSSCNVPYLSGVFSELTKSSKVTGVLYDHRKYGIIIDIICDDGKTWKKIVARNPQSLHLIWAGDGQYGNKDVVNKLVRYQQCAKIQCPYSPPKIEVVFCNGVTNELAQAILDMGIEVQGERIPVSTDVLEKLQSINLSDSEEEQSDSDQSLYESCDESEGEDKLEQHETQPRNETNDSASTAEELLSPEVTKILNLDSNSKLFLDITAMIVYVCDVCHGGHEYKLDDKILDAQAAEEKELSALDYMNEIMKSRELITCDTALKSFKDTLVMLGGDAERRRAEELLSKVTIVSDRLSAKFSTLIESGHIKHRSKIIFGTADFLRCPILTSNCGFIRGAAGQGLHVASFVHQSRALSEQKRLLVHPQS